VHQQVENTMGSFLVALDAGIDWVEADVRRTLDDELFVTHDAAFPDGVFLAEMTGAQARRHGALPVSEMLEALPAHAGVMFDVKSSLEDASRPATSTTAALFARISRRLVHERPVFASSFDPAALLHLRAESPSLSLGLTTWLRFPIGHAVAAAAHLDVEVLAVHAGSLWPNAATATVDVPALQRVVDQVHRADRELLVWGPTVDQSRHLAAVGVNAMVVDDAPAHVAGLSGQPNQSVAPPA
jgi:glycerophosphoryl diester phosphodiesterase